MNRQTITTSSTTETEAFAADLVKTLPLGTVIALHGNLGAGKTVFARGVARGLGVTEPVASPTFTIIQEYAVPNGNWFYHLDLYRIDNSDAALVFGVDEYLEAPHAITVLEWPERIEDLLSDSVVRISIEQVSDEEREITVESC